MLEKKWLPFAVSIMGCSSDYVTSLIGLSRGFYEAHPNYSPITALSLFLGISCLSLLPIKNRLFKLSILAIVSSSFIGAVSNSLLLMGI